MGSTTTAQRLEWHKRNRPFPRPGARLDEFVATDGTDSWAIGPVDAISDVYVVTRNHAAEVGRTMDLPRAKVFAEADRADLAERRSEAEAQLEASGYTEARALTVDAHDAIDTAVNQLVGLIGRGVVDHDSPTGEAIDSARQILVDEMTRLAPAAEDHREGHDDVFLPSDEARAAVRRTGRRGDVDDEASS